MPPVRNMGRSEENSPRLSAHLRSVLREKLQKEELLMQHLGAFLMHKFD